MKKINVLLACISKSPFKEALTAEIQQLTSERNQYRTYANKFRWLLINSNKWSWMPSQYNKDIVSGFSANNTGYLGYNFHTALKLAMKEKK